MANLLSRLFAIGKGECPRTFSIKLRTEFGASGDEFVSLGLHSPKLVTVGNGTDL
jgi:hypothetical protein